MSVGAQTSRLAVLVFTDVVGSSELKNRLGVLTYAKLLARHDAIFRELLAEFPSAEVLQDTGDGFFAAFQTVGDAVRFAALDDTDRWRVQVLAAIEESRSPERRPAARARNIAQGSRFSWHAYAQAMAGLYRAVGAEAIPDQAPLAAGA